MRTKLPLLLALALVISIASAGCDQGAAVPKAVPTSTTASSAIPKKEALTTITLSLRHTFIKATSQKRLHMLEDAVSAAEQAIPGLRIDLEAADDNINRDVKLKSDMAAGNPPGIFDMYGGAADAFIYASRINC